MFDQVLNFKMTEVYIILLRCLEKADVCVCVCNELSHIQINYPDY
jgi:hypothetical protein